MKTKLIMLALLAMQSACSGGSSADVNANDSSATTSESARTDAGSVGSNVVVNTGSGTVIANNDIPNVFAQPRTAASGSAISSSVTTSTAPSNATVVTDVTTTTQAVLKPLTEKEKIDALEKLGKLPTLDRSDSLLGTDLDKNGIRDDIDAFIVAQNYSQQQMRSVQKTAIALENILLSDVSNQSELESTDKTLQKAIGCVYSTFPETGNQAHFAIKNIEKIIVNTRNRVEQYIKYQIAMNGHILFSPKGDPCE